VRRIHDLRRARAIPGSRLLLRFSVRQALDQISRDCKVRAKAAPLQPWVRLSTGDDPSGVKVPQPFWRSHPCSGMRTLSIPGATPSLVTTPTIALSIRSVLKPIGKTGLAKKMEQPTKPIRVAKPLILLVDDHPIFRLGLEAFLKQHQPEWVCVHADTPLLAMESIRDVPPISRSWMFPWQATTGLN
jgi:hypothetical protein